MPAISADLIHGYFDGTLSAADGALLNELLRGDPATARQFAEIALLHDALHNQFAATRELAVHTPPPFNLPNDTKLGRTLPVKSPFREVQKSPALPRQDRMRRRLAAAAVTVAGVMAWGLWPGHRPASTGRLTRVMGSVQVVDAAGTRRSAAAGQAIQEGDSFETEGFASSAVFENEEGVQVELSGNAAATYTSSNQFTRLQLAKGLLSATVAPQPRGRPLVVATDWAQVETLGTKFMVQAAADRMAVDVWEGRIRLAGAGTEATAEVGQGERGGIGRSAPLAVTPIPASPQAWDVDFEQGLPPDAFAAHMTDGLPRNSKGAGQAKFLTQFGANFMVAVRDDSLQGLCQVTPESHFHVIYRLAHPEWLNVFIAAGSHDGRGPQFENYKNTAITRRLPPAGVWRRITIPLSQFQRVSPRDPSGSSVWSGGAPPAGDIIRAVWIGSPPPDRGLVVDRMWITPDGPGRVVIENVD